MSVLLPSSTLPQVKEPQQLFAFVLLQVGVNVGGDQFRMM